MLKNIENQTSPLTPGSKRNAESMLQQYAGAPAISQSTETLASDTQSDCENYAYKKPRVHGDNSISDKVNPSKVVHVRNLPHDTSETEVMHLAEKHGNVTNLILMRNKRQAFVEMLEVSQATAFIRFHQNPMLPAIIRGHTVQLQYSATYSELKPGQRSHANGMKPTPVLHVNIDNLIYPITLHILHSVFSRFGVVEKIITFTKNGQFQSLIQMSDVNSAQAAKQELDGKMIFTNCCVLRIDFSKMISVNVKYNNDKSRDFTNPDLPSGDESSPCPPAMSLPSAAAALQLEPRQRHCLICWGR
ncbi:hypothetical protein EB796_018067 [Bugula neritina]|uniref:RRM domain-containing protein n=1 Tax=Bugula neritina TaxID=10212 RepID=A0A7J7JE22_BUGNE|nr:hypothetical protein EB796_018067 [Bugula neritina]